MNGRLINFEILSHVFTEVRRLIFKSLVVTPMICATLNFAGGSNQFKLLFQLKKTVWLIWFDSQSSLCSTQMFVCRHEKESSKKKKKKKKFNLIRRTSINTHAKFVFMSYICRACVALKGVEFGHIVPISQCICLVHSCLNQAQM